MNRDIKFVASIISYNNCHEIWHCLNSVIKMDAIYVVDGYSKDSTVALMRSWAQRNDYKNLTMAQCEWQDDFAKQRNNCLNLIQQDYDDGDNIWVLMIDCDDTLGKFDREALTGMIQSHHRRVAMPMLYSRATKACYPETKDFNGVRMFKLSPYCLWKNAVHEYIDVDESTTDYDDIGDAYNILTVDSNVVSQNIGYAVQHQNDPLRNIRIGRGLVADKPDNIRVRFFLARDLMLDATGERASEYATEALEHIRAYIRLHDGVPKDKRNIERDGAVMNLTAKALAIVYSEEIANQYLMAKAISAAMR